MKTLSEVINAFEEAGVDVRSLYWDDYDSDHVDLVILIKGRRSVVASISYSPIGTGERGEILIEAVAE